MKTFSMFVDPISLLVVFIPMLVTSVTLWFACNAKWNVLFRDLGVPLGLFWSVVGATGAVVNMTDASNFGPSTAIMLLTITYGGLLSALGYFSTFKRSKPSSQNDQQTASWKAITLILGAFLGVILWGTNLGGLSAYINPIALAVLATTVVAAVLLSDSDYRIEVLCQASLLSAMISLVLGW